MNASQTYLDRLATTCKDANPNQEWNQEGIIIHSAVFEIESKIFQRMWGDNALSKNIFFWDHAQAMKYLTSSFVGKQHYAKYRKTMNVQNSKLKNI